MRISYTYAIDGIPELQARWRAAIKTQNALSKLATFDLKRRLEQLDILCHELERNYKVQVSNQMEAKRLQRGVFWWIAVWVSIGALSWSVSAVSNFSMSDTGWWIWVGGFSLPLIARLYAKAKCEEAIAFAKARIAGALYEFEILADTVFPYYDLELLDEYSWSQKNTQEDTKAAIDTLEARRAELIVEVTESLVEKIQRMDAVSVTDEALK